MRGMIDGEWHPELDARADTADDLAAAFATPAARVAIDPERLARDPASYLLYAALACPFAHRALLARTLVGLDALPVRLMHPWLGGPDGWTLREPRADGNEAGHGSAARHDPPATRYLWQVYRAGDPRYTGRVSVPVLWDREAGAIASAESREIVDAIVATQALRGRESAVLGIEGEPGHAALAEWIGDRVNVGVYRVGFAATQADYEAAHDAFVSALAGLDARAAGRRFLLGDVPGVADLMLFATAARFDAAYHGAFLLLDTLWRDHANLEAHRRRMMTLPGVASTVALDDYRVHYFDDAAFDVRRAGTDGHFIVPRTFGGAAVTGTRASARVPAEGVAS